MVFKEFVELGRVHVGHRVLPGECLEGPLGVDSPLQAIGCDAEGELDVGVEADDALDAVEPAVYTGEQFGQFQGAEFGGEAFHCLVVEEFVFDVAEVSGVVAADLLSFESDLTAGFTGGKIEGAQAGGLGHG
ncbi:MAG: hypothetical protein WA419_03135, partial [Silvibacterium sp.]